MRVAGRVWLQVGLSAVVLVLVLAVVLRTDKETVRALRGLLLGRRRQQHQHHHAAETSAGAGEPGQPPTDKKKD